MILYMYIALVHGLTIPWGQNFNVNSNILSLWLFVESLKKISLKSDFIQFFFMILHIYIAPGQGQTAPQGQSFDVNRNVLSFHSFVASFRKMSRSTQGHHLSKLGSTRSPDEAYQDSRSQAFWFWRKLFFFLGFYHIWAWWPSWSCDQDFHSPIPLKLHMKFDWLAQWFLRRKCLKSVDDNDGGLPIL